MRMVTNRRQRGADVWSTLDGPMWKKYVLASQLETLTRLAVGREDDPRVVTAYAAWRKGDAYAMGELVHQLGG